MAILYLWKSNAPQAYIFFTNTLTKSTAILSYSNKIDEDTTVYTSVELFLKKIGHKSCCSKVDCYGTLNPKFHFDLLLFTWRRAAQGLIHFLPVTLKSGEKKNFI